MLLKKYQKYLYTWLYQTKYTPFFALVSSYFQCIYSILPIVSIQNIDKVEGYNSLFEIYPSHIWYVGILLQDIAGT